MCASRLPEPRARQICAEIAYVISPPCRTVRTNGLKTLQPKDADRSPASRRKDAGDGSANRFRRSRRSQQAGLALFGDTGGLRSAQTVAVDAAVYHRVRDVDALRAELARHALADHPQA